MSDTKTVTWNDDPAHFRKVNRREFLYAGLVGSLGLTMGDYFKLRAKEFEALGCTIRLEFRPSWNSGAPADVIDGTDLLIGVSGARVMPAVPTARPLASTSRRFVVKHHCAV